MSSTATGERISRALSRFTARQPCGQDDATFSRISNAYASARCQANKNCCVLTVDLTCVKSLVGHGPSLG